MGRDCSNGLSCLGVWDYLGFFLNWCVFQHLHQVKVNKEGVIAGFGYQRKEKTDSRPRCQGQVCPDTKMCLPIGSERGTTSSGFKLGFPNQSSFHFHSEARVLQLVR